MPSSFSISESAGRRNVSGPRVLVVTPTLGESPFLDQTAASVAALPIATLHLLSAPVALAPRLRERFPAARVVPDRGPAAGLYGAINAALAAAAGDATWEWFTYINDDDALLPGCAAVLRHHCESGAAQTVIYGDVTAVDANGRTIALVTTESDPRRIPALLQEGISPLMQQGLLMHRRIVERLGGFDPRYALCADLDFWLRAYTGGAGFRYYPRRVARFRIRRGQLSGDTARTEREQTEIVRRLLPEPVGALRRRLARWRYRARNLPRYLARARRRGFRTSYQLLRHEASPP